MGDETHSRTMDCPDCGGMVSKRAASCPRCGAPVEVFTEADATGNNEVISLDSDHFLVTGQDIRKTFNNILTGLDKSVVISGQYPETGKIDIALRSGMDLSINTTQESRGAVVEVKSTAQISQPLFFRNALTDLAILEFVAIRNKVILAIGGGPTILNRFPEKNSTGIIKITRKNQFFRGSVNVSVEPDFENIKGSVKVGKTLEFSHQVGKYIVALRIVETTGTMIFTGEDKNAPVIDTTWCQVNVEENNITNIFVSTTGNGLTGVNLVLETSFPSPGSPSPPSSPSAATSAPPLVSQTSSIQQPPKPTATRSAAPPKATRPPPPPPIRPRRNKPG